MRFIFVALLSLFLGKLLAAASSPAAEPGRRPNILLAISDDQSWKHASPYGCRGLETPAMDRIAREGVLLANAFSAGPMCTVSRACLLTGRNVWQNREAGAHWSVFPRHLTVYPDLLQQAGYEIGFTGKGWSPGEWRQTLWPHNPAGPEFNQQKCEPPASGIRNLDYAANFIEFLEQKPGDKPFCFWYGAYEPHGPYEKGSGARAGKNPDELDLPPFLEDTPAARSNLLDIFLEIEWFDQHLGRMLAALEARGELDNTLVLATGDNGTSISHAKANLYEWGVHVPMAIRWPARIRGGRLLDDLISFIDVAPTLLEAARLDAPPDMAGRSFLASLTSGRSGPVDLQRDRVLLGQERSSHIRFDNLGYPMRAIRTPQYLYIWNLKPDRWPQGDPALFLWGQYGSRSQQEFREGLPPDWKRRPAEQLFDIVQDQACLHDLAGDPAFREIRQQLRQRLERELTEEGDPRMLGYGDIFESYPRFGPMRPACGGFAEQGKYNPKYQVEPPQR